LYQGDRAYLVVVLGCFVVVVAPLLACSFALLFSRTWVSIIGGCCCGILGLTNWSGFMFYLLTALLTTVVLAGKAAFSPAELRKSFVTLAAVTTDGLVAGCMSYVLFWTSVDSHASHGTQHNAQRNADRESERQR
jgi:hypothetical protein